MNIPKIIWILWLQGEHKAPYVVQKCITSWREKNPSWDIRILDEISISEYLPNYQPVNNISMTTQSDIIRLELLVKYGGVWADATTYCNKPLDNWLSDVMQSGFFVFYKPGEDRLISSWFIAATKDNNLIEKFLVAFKAYWQSFTINKNNLENKLLMRILRRFFQRNIHSTRHWFNIIPTKILGVYPYFVFHYLFADLTQKDPIIKNIWSETVKISADIPHIIQNIGIYSDVTSDITNTLQKIDAPLYKLTYKYDADKIKENSLLNYILE